MKLKLEDLRYALEEAHKENYRVPVFVENKKIETDDCPHDEHDHGVCLDCGKDITESLIARAESYWEGER